MLSRQSQVLVFVSLICLLGARVSPSSAAECVNYEDSLHWSTRLDWPDDLTDIRVDRHFAFLTSENFGLLVLDIQNPDAPTTTAILGLERPPSHLSLHRGRAYLTGRSSIWAHKSGSRLTIVDVDDPRAPSTLGSVNFPGVAFRSDVYRNHAFVAAGADGIRVFDVSDPTRPRLQRTLAGREIVDVRMDYPNLYAVSVTQGLVVYDFSDWNSPRQTQIIPAAGTASRLAVTGNRVYMTDSDHRITTMDASSSSSLVAVGQMRPLGNPTELTILPGRAYLADDRSLQILAMDRGQPTTLVTRLWADDTITGLAVANDHAFVTTASKGLLIADLSTEMRVSAGPSQVSEGMGSWHLSRGDLTVVNDGRRVRLLRTSDAAPPLELSRIEYWSSFVGVVLYEDYLFLGTDYGHLLTLDIADPTSPVIVSDIYTGRSVQSMARHRRRLYLSDYSQSLWSIDITNPRSPKVVGDIDGFPYVVNIFVHGDRALLNIQNSHAMIVSLADPDHPRVLSDFEVPMHNYSPRQDASRVLFTTRHGFRLVDFSNPENLVVSTFDGIYRQPRDIAVSRDIVYLPDGAAGVAAVDISKLRAPRLLGHAITDNASSYLVNGASSLWSISFASYPDYQDRVSQIPLQCTAAIAPRATGSGPVVLAPSTLRIGAHPNPFNPTTSIDFELPSSAPTSVSIYDLAGRRVRMLMPTTVLDAGPHSVEWNGQDDSGRPVASGVYLFRVRAGAVAETGRLALLK